MDINNIPVELKIAIEKYCGLKVADNKVFCHLTSSEIWSKLLGSARNVEWQSKLLDAHKKSTGYEKEVPLDHELQANHFYFYGYSLAENITSFITGLLENSEAEIFALSPKTTSKPKVEIRNIDAKKMEDMYGMKSAEQLNKILDDGKDYDSQIFVITDLELCSPATRNIVKDFFLFEKSVIVFYCSELPDFKSLETPSLQDDFVYYASTLANPMIFTPSIITKLNSKGVEHESIA